MNKKIIAAIIIVIVIILGTIGFYFWNKYNNGVSMPVAPSQTETIKSKEDATANINQSINAIDIGDIDSGFQDIDKNLNNL